MANDASRLVVASKGQIHIAPVGTTEPTDEATAPATPWIDTGYVSEEGVTFGNGITVEEFKAWQSAIAVRREVTDREVSANFTLQEWSKDTVALAFGGGTVTTVSPGHYKYAFPAPDDPLDEKALLISWQNNGHKYRLAFKRVSLSDGGETTLTRGALAMLPVAFKAMAPSGGGMGVSLLTDDPAFGTGS